MKYRLKDLPRWSLVLASVLLFALFVTGACGGGNSPDGEPLSPEEYFQTLAAATASGNDAIEKATQDLDPDSLEHLKVSVENFDLAAGAFISAMDGVTPPVGLQGQHDIFVDLFRLAQAQLRDLANRLEEVESLAEAELLLMEAEPVDDALNAVCLEFDDFAAEKGLEADLPC